MDSITRLQRTIGNQAVQRMLQAQADDFEDRFNAERESGFVERPGQNDEQSRTKRAGPSTLEHAHAPPFANEALISWGQPLDPATRRFMEARIGYDLSGVRVHTDGRAAALARAVGALAFTMGSHIVFGAGRYEPRSPSGAGLLAHELAHVAQARGRPPTLRRQPDPARLNIVVPDVSTATPFKPDYDYAWQNPILRKSVFTGRESEFRDFLLREKGEELRTELKGAGFTAAMATDLGEQILAERKRLTDELAEHTRLRKQAEADLRTAQAETRKHLAEPEVREQQRKQRALEEQRKRLANRAQAQQARIAELERKGNSIGSGEQRELDRRRGLLEDINAELEPTVQSLAAVSGELETGMAPFSSAEAKLRGEIKEHKTEEGTLRPQLARVSGGVDSRSKKATREAAVQWRLREFGERLNGMGHDELLGLILDEFAEDKNFTRFPKQVRYLVIHFSGMRYRTANRTWGPPQELLATLKEQQIRQMFADADEKKVEEEAQATSAAIEGELKSKDIGGARKAELLAVKKGLDMPAAVQAQLFARNPQEARAFEDLEMYTHARAEAVARGDSEAAEEDSQRIEHLERQIGAPRLKQIRTRLAEADRKRLEKLRDFRVREARQAMNSLNDLQALGLLQDMKDAFPPWVWHEVVRRTQLRVNVTDPNWDDPTATTKGLDPKDPVTARWQAILRGWPRESTAWNKKHSEVYEIVATAVVCNQLAESVQHLRGLNIDQSIRGAVNWYRRRAAEANDKGVTGADTPRFIRPTKIADFVPGSGLFWAHFESKLPAKGNMAHPLEGIDFLTEGKQVMKDGLVEGGWTYHVDPSTGDITRTKAKGDAVETQWFAWQHEATVIAPKEGAVTTFETQRHSARMHSWSLKSLLDPMSEPWIRDQHGDTNVFLGFAPEGRVLPQLDKSLENILPGRSAF
jgi:Domain of unknown function (DUF4157)